MAKHRPENRYAGGKRGREIKPPPKGYVRDRSTKHIMFTDQQGWGHLSSVKKGGRAHRKKSGCAIVLLAWLAGIGSLAGIVASARGWA